MKRTTLLLLVLTLSMGWEVVKADFTFGTPENLGASINTSVEDGGPSISADGLSLIFYSFYNGWANPTMRMATRENTEDPWIDVVNLSPPVSVGASPCISADGLSLFFESFQLGGYGGSDIFISTRSTTSESWGTPENLGQAINSSDLDMGPSISADGLTLFWQSPRPGGFGQEDIYVSTRPSLSEPWSQAVNLGSRINSSSLDLAPCISSDGLILFFCSDRPGGYGDLDIWMTTRATQNDDWGDPVNLGPSVNTSAGEADPCISANGRTLYFSDWNIPHPGGVGKIDLWQASIEPIVDFNGDSKVDGKDILIMTELWGENDTLCDIGPTPFGDGVVDLRDVIALAEYVGEDVSDPTLVAHWTLDETDGMIVTDNAGGSTGYALGNPLWQPDGGQVDGSLEFDGVDDFISAPTVLNPADGPFSVLVWIKGGAAGQTIISEGGGPNWLSFDPLTGYLMTELKGTGRNTGPLLSQTVIPDDYWHRIVFVWDGLNRMLYVDGIIVAEDTQDDLESTGSGLYIGCGNPTQPSTFFSGLIDDVRIYNRAMHP